MAKGPEPDIFVRILNKVEQIDGVEAQLREIKNVLHEHDRRFDRIDQTLAGHDRRFDRMDRTLALQTLRLDQLDTAVVDLRQDLRQHLAVSPS